MQQDMIVILDLGSTQSAQIAREIRALGVYTEIHPYDITAEQLAALPNVAGVRVLGAAGVVEVRCMPSRGDIDRVIDETGVWLRPFSNVIDTMPPLVSDTEVIARITSAMTDLASAPPGPPPEDDGFHE